MHFRHVLTYDFSDDNTRASFKELLEEMQYVEAEDQSTYVLPYNVSLKSIVVVDAIVKWSEDKTIVISSKDFVQLFYLIQTFEKVTKICSRFLKYNTKAKGLI